MLVCNPGLRVLVKTKLEDTWSPQQIASCLRNEHPERTEWHVCHETVYQASTSVERGWPEQDIDHEAAHRPTPAQAPPPGLRADHSLVAPALLIHSRPAIVETRTKIGDWEGDLIVGRQSRSAIGTLVDRTRRSVRLIHLPNGHGADAFVEAAPQYWPCSLTTDG